MCYKNNELYHYGVKGMKWGVRRYQNKDGTLTKAGMKKYSKTQNKLATSASDRTEFTRERTIPVGTTMYRTTGGKEDNRNGAKYVSYLDVDRNHYNGGYIRSRSGTKSAYEHSYELTKELKIPSRAHQQDVINQAVRKNKNYLNEAVKGYVDQLIPKNTLDRFQVEDTYPGGVKQYVKDTVKIWEKRSPEELAFSVSQSLGLAPNVKREIISKLSKEGYNAMVDEASVGGQHGWMREGYDPLLVFDPSVLKEINLKEIDSKKERRAYNKDIKWQRKARTKNAAWSAI